ncbi:CLUMA_CG008302, isoform A [Clunio marinus]|uniref:CLUMA_CG008302, isoform A n=1 Tax=Clunio marinus TaxID=568069 RepID=A0A1J1I3C2_9DIPT|nr:CLUMA_CG008302, isoform A [Clunio marinus]
MYQCSCFLGDIFSGLNDGLLSRAEALAAVDMQKHQSTHAAHQQMTQQLKHDVMYHHGMGGPPQRPLQAHKISYLLTIGAVV